MPRITTIPVTKPLHSTTTTISGQQLRRVAGYARVSTEASWVLFRFLYGGQLS